MTINDIARMSGVSKSTVSRYLNGGSVSKKSAEKIAQAVQETGFVLNVSASRLKMNRSLLVGVLVDGISSPSVQKEIVAINSTLHELGYQPFVMLDEPDQDNKVSGMRALVAQGVDGIIYGTARLTKEQSRYLLSSGTPTLLLGQRSELFPFCKMDDEAAGRLLARHVLEQEPRHVVYLNLPHYDVATSQERWRGFADTLAAAGVRVSELEVGYRRKDGYAAGDRVLAMGADFVVGASDRLCLGLLQYLGEHGVSVPGDIRMAGFGNHDVSELPMISLTSVDFDYAAMGRDAARKIVRLIDGDDVARQSTSYPMRLVVRRSSIAPGA